MSVLLAGACLLMAQGPVRGGRVYRVMSFEQARLIEGTEARVVYALSGGQVVVSVPAGGAAATFAETMPGIAEPLPAGDPGSKVSPVLRALPDVEAFVVELYPDAEPLVGRQIVLDASGLLLPHPELLDHQLLVQGGLAVAERIAEAEEVAYVFPASAELVSGVALHVCAGAMTEIGPVAPYIQRMGDGWEGPGRNSARLLYLFARLTPQQPEDAIQSEFRKALDEWSRHVRVDFIEGGDPGAPRHLNVLFARGPHGDAYPFDGRGRVLAHTFYPAPPNPEPIAGDLHFDEEEAWRIGADTDFYSVALHELGHALGLGHSDRPGTVMYAFYRRADKLTAEDIAAIQELYAAREASNPAPPASPPANPPSPPPGPDRTPPSLSITAPSTTVVQTTAAVIRIQGIAADNVGVSRVAWSAAAGSGVAAGTNSWIADVPLLRGTNQIAIRVYDAAGNIAWRSITVVRR